MTNVFLYDCCVVHEKIVSYSSNKTEGLSTNKNFFVPSHYFLCIYVYMRWRRWWWCLLLRSFISTYRRRERSQSYFFPFLHMYFCTVVMYCFVLCSSIAWSMDANWASLCYSTSQQLWNSVVASKKDNVKGIIWLGVYRWWVNLNVVVMIDICLQRLILLGAFHSQEAVTSS